MIFLIEELVVAVVGLWKMAVGYRPLNIMILNAENAVLFSIIMVNYKRYNHAK